MALIIYIIGATFAGKTKIAQSEARPLLCLTNIESVYDFFSAQAKHVHYMCTTNTHTHGIWYSFRIVDHRSTMEHSRIRALSFLNKNSYWKTVRQLNSSVATQRNLKSISHCLVCSAANQIVQRACARAYAIVTTDSQFYDNGAQLLISILCHANIVAEVLLISMSRWCKRYLSF